MHSKRKLGRNLSRKGDIHMANNHMVKGQLCYSQENVNKNHCKVQEMAKRMWKISTLSAKMWSSWDCHTVMEEG